MVDEISFRAIAAPNETTATGIDGNNIIGYYPSATGYHSFLYDGTTNRSQLIVRVPITTAIGLEPR